MYVCEMQYDVKYFYFTGTHTRFKIQTKFEMLLNTEPIHTQTFNQGLFISLHIYTFSFIYLLVLMFLTQKDIYPSCLNQIYLCLDSIKLFIFSKLWWEDNIIIF